MADPITWTAGASLFGTVASAGIGFMGASDKASASSDMYMYKAAIAQRNQQMALQQQERDVFQGGEKAFNNDLKARAQIGTARADAGASGFDVNTGSKAAAVDSAHMIDRMNSLQIVSEAQQKGYQDVVQAWNYGNESEMDQRSAENARRSGTWDETSSLVSGSTSLADKWTGYQNKGVFK